MTLNGVTTADARFLCGRDAETLCYVGLRLRLQCWKIYDSRPRLQLPAQNETPNPTLRLIVLHSVLKEDLREICKFF